ncbi:MAG: DUF1579 family protein [Ignavibacteria bacterium]|nr:DUF1579 family protein [Ignavibacteria bacterium]
MRVLIFCLSAVCFFGISCIKAQIDPVFFQKYYSITPEHQYIGQFAGKFRLLISFQHDKTEEYAKGTTNASFILNYRILQIENKVETQSGIQFDYNFYLGYHGVEEKFFLVGFDSFTNDFIALKGDYDQKKREFNFYGNRDDPKTKAKVKIRIRFWVERENKFWIEYYREVKGKESLVYKAMHIKLVEE